MAPSISATARLTDVQGPPLIAEYPFDVARLVADPLRAPDAQQNTNDADFGCFASQPSTSGNGMFFEPTTCPPRNSIGERTSIIVAPARSASPMPSDEPPPMRLRRMLSIAVLLMRVEHVTMNATNLVHASAAQQDFCHTDVNQNVTRNVANTLRGSAGMMPGPG